MKHIFTEVANHVGAGLNRPILIETDYVESVTLSEVVDSGNNTVQVANVVFTSGQKAAVLWPGGLADFAVALGIPRADSVRTYPLDDEPGDF